MFAAHAGRIQWHRGPAGGRLLHALGARAAADFTTVAVWLRRAACGLAGHMMVRHYEPGRLALECLACGRQTAGWTIDAHTHVAGMR